MKNKFQKRIHFKRISRFMLAIFIILINTVSINAQSSMSQVKRDFKVSNITVLQLVDKLGSEFKYSFFIVDEQIGETIISVDLKNATISEILESAFQKKAIAYKIIDKSITISIKKSQPIKINEIRKIAGVVLNTNSEPIFGATIFEKSTRKGTITDAKGKFSLDVPFESSITISYIGYITTTISVGKLNSFKIILEEDNKSLNEVVVVGYGSLKKKDLTGSVSSIKADEIIEAKSTSFIDALQGKMSGVQVSGQSGEVGASSRITIRGSNSVYGSSAPLYVIDGLQIDVNSNEIASATMGNGTQLDPMASINPSDIESIDILKDASSTAIYGSKGANGVIIVTTKSGKAGEAKIFYDGYMSFSTISKKMNVLNGSDFVDYRKEMDPNSFFFYSDSNGDGVYNSSDIPRNPYTFPTHNWQDEMLRTAISHSHNIMLNGGTKNLQFSGSLGYLSNEGIIINNNYERITSRMKVDFKKNKFKIGISLNTSNSDYSGVSQSGGEGGVFNGVVQYLITSRPIEIFVPSFDNTIKYISPIAMIKSATKNTNLLKSYINSYAEYTIFDGLTFTVNLGGNLSSSKGKEYYSRDTEWGASARGIGIISEKRSSNFTNSEQLNFKRKIGQSSFNTMLAFEMSNYNFESFDIQNTNFLDESTGIDAIAKGNVLRSVNSYREGNKHISYLGRINYDYNGRYLVTASMRADGSDKFGKGNRFGYFPSLALAWRVTEEKFMQQQNTIDNLKLRLSYGLTGNDRILSYQYFANMENAYYNAYLGLSPSSLSNPKLKWETTIQYNAGIDFGVFDGRIQITGDLYKKVTTDMLMPAPIPSQSGFMKQWQNIGKVSNEGLELQISTMNIKTKDFQWNTNFNISFNKNTVLNLGGVDFIPVSIGGGFINNVGRVIVGESIGTAYGYVFDGVYQINDFTWQNNSDPTISHTSRMYDLKPEVISIKGLNVKPGSFKFKNVNQSTDNIVDENDQTIISHSSPKFFGGINNSFKYKDFELSVFLNGSYGNQVFNESKFRLTGGVPMAWQNLLQDFWDNRWTPDNPTNKYGTYSVNTLNITSQIASSYYVEDASFLRLQTVTMGYNLPANILKKLLHGSISNFKIYLTGNNLYTWTNYSGFDPEVDSNNALLTGFDRISYPRSRSYIFGLKLTL